MFFKGAGKIYVATRDTAGNPTVFRYLGKVANGAKFGLATTNETIYEAESGQALPALRYETRKDATLSLELQELTDKNAALALRSTASDITAGTVTGEVLANPIAVGDIVRLAKPKVSSVVVKDSTGAPKTLVQGTNYRINSADHGSLEFLDLTTGAPYVQPFKADYSNALARQIPIFTQPAAEYWVRCELLNTSPDAVGQLGAKVLVEFYRVNLDALKEWLLKGEAVASFALDGAVLYDDTKAADPALGQFGRVVLV